MREIIEKFGWKKVQWSNDVFFLERMLLWLPIDRSETIITSENNYGNVLFKGLLETEPEIEFITNLLTKTDEN